jgi:beta-glucosidase
MDIKALLSSLTTEEKAGQLAQLPPYFFKKEALHEVAGPVQRLKLTEKEIFLAGSVLGVGNPEEMIQIQQTYLERSRHKIPLIFMADIIHGYKTIFPIPLALSGSFSKENFHLMARASAQEASLSGIHATFSPMADLVRDPRWGRVMESFGEDSFLAYQYAFAMTQGYQGDNLKKKDSIAACLKHFAAYGSPLAGRDYQQAVLSLHDYFQYYDAGYRGAIDAGARLAMSAFNVFEGIPSSISQYLLKQVLRKRYGFKGVTISDYDSITETVIHRVSENDAHAVEQAMLANLDIEMASGAYIKHIPSLISSGRLPMQLLDQAVLRVLKLKKDLGLFKNPFKGVDVKKEKTFPLSASQRLIAKKLADESIVLLKNDLQVLPLKQQQKFALLGKLNHHQGLFGPWSWHGDREKTPTLKDVLDPHFLLSNDIEDTTLWDHTTLTQILDADVFVVATGEFEKESGEARSKTNPTLDIKTIHFIKQLKAFNKPIVLILFAGRPLILTDIIDDVSSILYAYFLGSESSLTIKDTLLGLNNPSAKLTMSFPRSIGQIPMAYNALSSGRPFLGESFTYTSHYIDSINEPLFSFGHGLSYANFNITDFIQVASPTQLTFSVSVSNTSDIGGYAICNIFMQAPVASVALPNHQLVGTHKIYLHPLTTEKITITIDHQFLTYVDSNLKRQIHSGLATFFLHGTSLFQKILLPYQAL